MPSTEMVFKVLTELLGEDVFNDFASNYEKRLLVQKALYVYQEASQKDLFGYSWYVAGPYSPTVSSIIYHSLIPEINIKRTEWDTIEFSDVALERIDKVKAYLSYDIVDNDVNQVEKTAAYELLASMLYMSKYGKSQDIVCEKLIQTKGKKFGNEKVKSFVSQNWPRLEKFYV